MTNKYIEYMDNHDFYETEANKHHNNPFKWAIFKYLAADYKKKALKLKIAEVCR